MSEFGCVFYDLFFFLWSCVVVVVVVVVGEISTIDHNSESDTGCRLTGECSSFFAGAFSVASPLALS